MTNALTLGQNVFFGQRKATVIERDGLYVTVVVFDRDGQRIVEHVPARVFTITRRNVRRRLGQSARGAIVAHHASLPIDGRIVLGGLAALIAAFGVLVAFVLTIACRWAV